MLGNLGRHIPAVIVVGIATAVLGLTVRPVGVEPVAAVVGGRLVALMLLVAASALWFAGRRPAAVAAALAGLSWAGVVWSLERASGADALVGAGMLLSPLLTPMLALLVLALPGLWQVPRRVERVLVTASLVAAVAGVMRALVYEPILDLHCGPFCGHSPVLVVADLGLAAWLGGLAAALSGAVCGTIALGIVYAAAGGERGLRRGVPPRVLTVAGLLFLSAAALVTIVPAGGGATAEDIVRLVALRAVACMAVAGAAILVAAERLAVGRNLARLARLLAVESDRPSAEALLRDAVGDPGLAVGYWTDERGYIGADGRPLDLADPGRQRTELTSRGRPVAVVVHDPRALGSDLLDEHIGPEARLAIQNESLELELERRIEQLNASRRRVVEAGDAERRQLERDLHDGAQQLLLALSFEVRRGERSAADAGDEAAAAGFAEIRRVAGRILEQLRVLAHGIHPMILTTAGLEPALATYLAALDAPPSLTVQLPRRLAPASEASAYAIVTALIAAAPEGSEASFVVREDGDVIRIGVDGPQPVPDHVIDRLGAAGGTWATGPDGSEFVLPCG